MIPAGAADAMIQEFRRAVRAGLAAVPRIASTKHITAQHPGRDLLEFCSETGREDAILRFTADTAIWRTNNISERGVRPTKTQQKVSGRLASEDTTQDRLDIRSYIDTARKHGQDALTDRSVRIFTGNPWRPPAAWAIALTPASNPSHPISPTAHGGMLPRRGCGKSVGPGSSLWLAPGYRREHE